MRAKSRAIRSSAKSPPRFRGFPSSSSGVGVGRGREPFSRLFTKPTGARPPKRRSKARASKRLRPKTADGIRIEPVYPPAEGPRAIRPGGPWRVIARLDHPDAERGQRPGARRPRQWRGRPADRILRRDRRLWIWPQTVRFGLASQGLRWRALRRRARVSNSILGRTARTQALRFAALIERSGAKPEDCAVAFGLDPFAASARGPFPGGLERSGDAPMSRPRSHCGARASAGRSWSPTRAPSMRRAEARRKSSPLRSRRRQPVAIARGGRDDACRSARADRVPAGGRRGRIRRRLSKFRALRIALVARRGGVRPRASRGACAGRKRLAHDDGARPLCECHARRDGGVLGRPRRRRQRQRAAAHSGRRPSRQPRAPPRPQRPAHPPARIESRICRRPSRRRRARSRR